MPKILVIDDNPDMRAALRMPLEAHDYEFFTAENAEKDEYKRKCKAAVRG